MNIYDILILIVIFIVTAAIVLRLFISGRSGGCSSSCAGCKGCNVPESKGKAGNIKRNGTY